MTVGSKTWLMRVSENLMMESSHQRWKHQRWNLLLLVTYVSGSSTKLKGFRPKIYICMSQHYKNWPEKKYMSGAPGDIGVYRWVRASSLPAAGWAAAQRRSSACWGAGSARQPGASPPPAALPCSSVGSAIAPYVRLQFECNLILFFPRSVLHLNHFSLLFLPLSNPELRSLGDKDGAVTRKGTCPTVWVREGSVEMAVQELHVISLILIMMLNAIYQIPTFARRGDKPSACIIPFNTYTM